MVSGGATSGAFSQHDCRCAATEHVIGHHVSATNDVITELPPRHNSRYSRASRYHYDNFHIVFVQYRIRIIILYAIWQKQFIHIVSSYIFCFAWMELNVFYTLTIILLCLTAPHMGNSQQWPGYGMMGQGQSSHMQQSAPVRYWPHHFSLRWRHAF